MAEIIGSGKDPDYTGFVLTLKHESGNVSQYFFKDQETGNTAYSAVQGNQPCSFKHTCGIASVDPTKFYEINFGTVESMVNQLSQIQLINAHAQVLGVVRAEQKTAHLARMGRRG